MSLNNTNLKLKPHLQVTSPSTTQQNQTVIQILPPSNTIQPIPGRVSTAGEGPNGKFTCDVCHKVFQRQSQLAVCTLVVGQSRVYLRQGDYVFGSVCLFVCLLTTLLKKVINGLR